jgi:hypothetical protein
LEALVFDVTSLFATVFFFRAKSPALESFQAGGFCTLRRDIEILEALSPYFFAARIPPTIDRIMTIFPGVRFTPPCDEQAPCFPIDCDAQPSEQSVGPTSLPPIKAIVKKTKKPTTNFMIYHSLLMIETLLSFLKIFKN